MRPAFFEKDEDGRDGSYFGEALHLHEDEREDGESDCEGGDGQHAPPGQADEGVAPEDAVLDGSNDGFERLEDVWDLAQVVSIEVDES